MKALFFLISSLVLFSVAFDQCRDYREKDPIDHCPHHVDHGAHEYLSENIQSNCGGARTLTAADFLKFPKEPFAALSTSFTYYFNSSCDPTNDMNESFEFRFFQMEFEYEKEPIILFDLVRNYYSNPEWFVHYISFQADSAAVSEIIPGSGEDNWWEAGVVEYPEEQGPTKCIMLVDYKSKSAKTWLVNAHSNYYYMDYHPNLFSYENGAGWDLFNNGRWRLDDSLKIHFGSDRNSTKLFNVLFTDFRLDYSYQRSLVTFLGTRSPNLVGAYSLQRTLKSSEGGLSALKYYENGYRAEENDDVNGTESQGHFTSEGSLRVRGEDYIYIDTEEFYPTLEPNAPFYSASMTFWLQIDEKVEEDQFAEFLEVDNGYWASWLHLYLRVNNSLRIGYDYYHTPGHDDIFTGFNIPTNTWNKFSIYAGGNENGYIGVLSLYVNETLIYETEEVGYTEGDADYPFMRLGGFVGNLEDLRLYSPGIIPSRLPCEKVLIEKGGSTPVIATLSAVGGAIVVGVLLILIVKKAITVSALKSTGVKYQHGGVNTGADQLRSPTQNVTGTQLN